MQRCLARNEKGTPISRGQERRRLSRLIEPRLPQVQGDGRSPGAQRARQALVEVVGKREKGGLLSSDRIRPQDLGNATPCQLYPGFVGYVHRSPAGPLGSLVMRRKFQNFTASFASRDEPEEDGGMNGPKQGSDFS
ncbi:hypothetical protein KM043_000728 [Ampulex compressa]|nr:hypothetical protein KM043_000728 [Ampulex compressa]